MPKLLKKIAIILSLITTIIGSLTFVMTYMNIGFGNDFLSQWLTSFLLAATTMAPLGFVMVAIISKLVTMVMPKASEAKRNLAVGIAMAFVMEGSMALVTTMNNLGFPATAERIYPWLQEWGQAFLVALPLGLVIGLIMSIFIKPRLERVMAS